MAASAARCLVLRCIAVAHKRLENQLPQRCLARSTDQLIMEMRALMAEERRNMELAVARKTVSGGVRASSIGWERPTCRHCPRYQQNFEAQSLYPFMGQVMFRRDTPTRVHLAVAQRQYPTYCDYLQAKSVAFDGVSLVDAAQVAARWAERLRVSSVAASSHEHASQAVPSNVKPRDKPVHVRVSRRPGESDHPVSSPLSLTRQSVGHAQRRAQLSSPPRRVPVASLVE